MMNYWKMQYISKLIITIFLAFTYTIPLFCQQTVELISFQRYKIGMDSIKFIPKSYPEVKIGLALSGGGTRGVAHIVLLEELEKNGIPVHSISGTSIGALVGGLYSSGYSPKEIKDIFYSYDWKKLYLDKASRKNVIVPQKENMGNYLIRLGFDKDGPYIPTSLSYGQNILNYMTIKTAASTYNYNHNYKELPVGLNIISTDLLSGNKIVFYSGNLSKNMLASMAFPLLFAPVEYDSLMLMDGGISNNIPVSEVRKIGANFVIANDVTAGLRNRKYLKLPWQIADQVTTIMMQDNLQKNQIAADFLFSPKLKKFSSTDVANFDKFRYIEKNEFIRNKGDLIRKINNCFNIDFKIDSIYVNEVIFDFYARDQLFHKKYQNVDTIVYLNSYFNLWKKQFKFDDISIIYANQSKKLFINLSYNGNPSKIMSSDSLFEVEIEDIIEKQPFLTYINPNELKILLRNYFNKKGFFACKVNKDSVTNVINVIPGKIDKVVVEGNSKTKDYVVIREIDENLFKKATNTDLDASIKNLYGTGLFHLIELFPYKDKNLTLLKVKVKEKPSFFAKLGLRYTNDRMAETKISFSEENLFGRKYNLITYGVLGNFRRNYGITLKSDKIYKSNFSAFSNLKFEKMIYPKYEKGKKTGEFSKETKNIEFGLGKSIERLGFVSMSLVFDHILGPSNSDFLSKSKFQSWGIKLLSIVDNRDKFPFPNSGEYIKWGWESYNQLYPDKLNSTKAWIEAFKYLKISKYSVLTFFSNNGIAENTLPFVKWFSPAETIRKNNWHNYEYFGKMYVISGIELRQQVFPYFWGEKYLSFKYDYGTLWSSSEEQFEWKDLESGFSMSFMLATIVGPVELKYEIAEKQKPFFWLNMGFIF